MSTLLFAAPAHARPGDLDRSFANGGRMGYLMYGSGGSVTGVTLLDGLRPLLSVDAAKDGTSAPTWMRLTSTGRVAARSLIPPPTRWAPRFFGRRTFVALPGYVGQQLQYLIGTADGRDSVTLTMPTADLVAGSFAVDDAGRIYLGGFNRPPGAAETSGVVLRFLASGALDTSWGTNGIASLAPLEFVTGLLLRGRRVHAFGSNRITTLDGNGQPVAGLARGRLVTPDERTTYYGSRMYEGPAGTLLVAGIDSSRGVYLTRRRADGRPDTRFGRRGYVTGLPALRDLDVTDLVRDRQGRLLVAGTVRDDEGAQTTIVRLSARGRVDRGFANQGRKRFQLGFVKGVSIVESAPGQILVDKRGRIVVVGTVYDADAEIREDFGNPYPAIARLQG